MRGSRIPKHRSPGRPCAEATAGRIADLLAIAAEVFMERGYAGASVAEIAQRANASKQTLYSRYRSKADLFTAVMNQRCEDAMVRVTDILESERPIARVLTSFAMELMAPSLKKDWPRMLRTIVASVETFPELGHTFWDAGPERAYEMISRYLEKRMRSGDLRKADSHEAARLFFAMCNGRYWLRDLLGIQPQATEAEVEAYTKRIVKIFLSIYKIPR